MCLASFDALNTFDLFEQILVRSCVLASHHCNAFHFPAFFDQRGCAAFRAIPDCSYLDKFSPVLAAESPELDCP
jgi:hypothetical protein